MLEVRERGPNAPRYISVYLCIGRLEPDNRHWAFRARSHAEVRAFYEAALTHGGTDDGPPGLRLSRPGERLAGVRPQGVMARRKPGRTCGR